MSQKDSALHEAIAAWSKIGAKIDAIDADTSEVLLGLKKSSSFISSNINYLLDPDLIPLASLVTMKQQANAALQQLEHYYSNNNISHLNSVVAHIDSIIPIILTYSLKDENAAENFHTFLVNYIADSKKKIFDIKAEAQGLLNSIQTDHKNISDTVTASLSMKEEIEHFKNDMLGSEKHRGIKDLIESSAKEVFKFHTETSKFYGEIFSGTDTIIPLKQQIINAKNEVQKDQVEINSELSAIKTKTEALKSFFEIALGSEEKNSKDTSIAQELERLKTNLKNFDKEQKIRYEALNAEINSLLPGATSAGLASAYKDMKDSFNSPIDTFSKIFYAAIAMLVIVSGFSSIQQIGGDSWISFKELSGLSNILESLLSRLPIYLPVVWLAYYASKRRSEAQRLQQEYAHKEALAKSYQSYKQQIDELQNDHDHLLMKLIAQAIEAISFNASATLDKSHGEQHPLQEIVSRTVDTLKQKTHG